MARHDFEFITELYDIQTIVKGSGVDQRNYLNQRFGRRRWRKMKRKAVIRYRDGRVVEAEIHWFEGHGVGKVLEKAIRNLN